jgi:hypothetical protein
VIGLDDRLVVALADGDVRVAVGVEAEFAQVDCL